MARRVASIVIALLAVVLLTDRYELLRDGGASENWPVVEARVVESSMLPLGGGRGGGAWTIRLTYAYTFGDRDFEGSRIRFTRQLNERSFEQAEAAMERYATGNTIDVRVSPDDPAQSVLEPGIDRTAWLGLVLALMMLAVSVIFWLVPTRVVRADER